MANFALHKYKIRYQLAIKGKCALRIGTKVYAVSLLSKIFKLAVATYILFNNNHLMLLLFS